MAPVKGCHESLLTRRRGVAPGAEQTEAVIEAFGDRRRSEGAESPGRKFERERQPVETKADASDVGRVVLVELESRLGSSCPLGEQADCLVSEQFVWCEASLRIWD